MSKTRIYDTNSLEQLLYIFMNVTIIYLVKLS